jgi:UDP-glucose 4-epimerase|tara:strand:+ start:1674 stop:2678 length:1005 start_codon:yes stop_codon:yes gene_type:complete
MKIFVTGIAGFLGGHVAENLLESGHEVSGCDNLIGGYLDNVPEDAEFYQVDAIYLNQMKKLTKGVDLVIHTACTAYEGLSVFSPYLVGQNTYQISMSVFTAVAENKIPKIINFSSMARYGTQEIVPFTEDLQPKPQDPYGIAKYASEETLKVLSEVHKFDYVNLVPHNIIGPKQKFDDPYRNVVSIMINRVLNGQPPIIYGDGQQKRCFSDISDVINPMVKSITSDRAVGQTINVGPDEDVITIEQLSEKILKVLNSDLKPIYVDPRPKEVAFAHCSADKARDILDYETSVSLDKSIEKIANWILSVGPKKFRYHLDIEIVNELTPKTWKERLF